ncbi:MAG: hypothetical protein ACRD6B_14380 [Bryobacteraceae bacterium]
MAIFVIRFSDPQELSSTFDGRCFCAPYSAVDREYFDSPRESAHTARTHINVKVSGTTLATWHLDEPGLLKAIFQVAKDHIMRLANSGANISQESTAAAIPSGPCPYDIIKIGAPGEAFVVDVHGPIGFVGGGDV